MNRCPPDASLSLTSRYERFWVLVAGKVKLACVPVVELRKERRFWLAPCRVRALLTVVVTDAGKVKVAAADVVLVRL